MISECTHVTRAGTSGQGWRPLQVPGARGFVPGKGCAATHLLFAPGPAGQNFFGGLRPAKPEQGLCPRRIAVKEQCTFARRARRGLVAVAVLIGSAAGVSSKASAAGLLIADGGFGGQLEIEEHGVEVTVENGIAVTEVTQVFRNLENRQVEALYTFPVPRGASVSNFSMWIGGKEMVGEVVEKKRARQIYDSYKARRIDPGLLEQT